MKLVKSFPARFTFANPSSCVFAGRGGRCCAPGSPGEERRDTESWSSCCHSYILTWKPYGPKGNCVWLHRYDVGVFFFCLNYSFNKQFSKLHFFIICFFCRLLEKWMLHWLVPPFTTIPILKRVKVKVKNILEHFIAGLIFYNSVIIFKSTPIPYLKRI